MIILTWIYLTIEGHVTFTTMIHVIKKGKTKEMKRTALFHTTIYILAVIGLIAKTFFNI